MPLQLPNASKVGVHYRSANFLAAQGYIRHSQHRTPTYRVILHHHRVRTVAPKAIVTGSQVYEDPAPMVVNYAAVSYVCEAGFRIIGALLQMENSKQISVALAPQVVVVKSEVPNRHVPRV